MTVQLTQSNEAGFTDRPVGGGVGLRVNCTVGDDGCYLEQEMDEAMGVVHARVMVHVETLSGGRVVLLRGMDEAGQECWRVTVDDEGKVWLSFGDGELDAVGMTAGIGWQCVECGIDAASGTGALWLNGRQVGSGSAGGVGETKRVWIGGVLKDWEAEGEIWLDEWVIGDGYVGPVVVKAEGEDASDEARWVAVYNSGDEESVAWAEWYRQRRGLPYANLIGLELATEETISEAEFDAMREATGAYLSLNGLAGQVLGIVLGHGVPGQYVGSEGKVESVAGRMHRLEGDAGSEVNEMFDADEPARLTEGNNGGMRVTGRIDGGTLEESKAMTERAMVIETEGLGDGSEAKLWLDAVTPGVTHAFLQGEMLAWAGGKGRGALRLPMEMTEADESGGEVSFASIDHDGFFVGWRQTSVPEGFFGEPRGKRVFAMQLDNTTATAGSLRGGGCWARAVVEAGYAATGGISRPISETALLRIEPMFEAMRRGWRLGEAWFAGLDVIGEGMTLVGDPMMRVKMPRAGWNVYGPFEEWADVRVDEPGVMLREDEVEIGLSGAMEPAEGSVSLYVVRHVDEVGKEEAGFRHVRVKREGGVLREMPGMMSWPTGTGWRAERVGGAWRIEVRWPREMGRAGVGSVRLIEEVEGGGAEQVEEIEAKARSWGVTFVRESEAAAVRYCVEAVGVSGAVVRSGWSGWMKGIGGDVGAVMLVDGGG